MSIIDLLNAFIGKIIIHFTMFLIYTIIFINFFYYMNELRYKHFLRLKMKIQINLVNRNEVGVATTPQIFFNFLYPLLSLSSRIDKVRIITSIN